MLIHKSTLVKKAIFIFLISLLFSTYNVAQQSTSSPYRPEGVSKGIINNNQKSVTIIEGVPTYIWHCGCGPTALGMVIGYYDTHGLVDLINGDASIQTEDVNNAIANDDHYNDYSLPLDSPPNLLADKSQLGDAHSSNCIADFMRTSWSSRPNYWGWSWGSDIDNAFINYSRFRNNNYAISTSYKGFSTITSWDDFKTEIDNNRPVILLVDTDGNGNTDHFVTGIGYDDADTLYAVYDTWDQNIHWYQWRGISNSYDWGIYSYTILNIEPLPIISGYVKDIDNIPIDKVTVTFDNAGGSTSTNTTGYYEHNVIDGYNGTATPSKPYFTFNPVSKPYTNVSSNLSNEDYTGIQSFIIEVLTDKYQYTQDETIEISIKAINQTEEEKVLEFHELIKSNYSIDGVYFNNGAAWSNNPNYSAITYIRIPASGDTTFTHHHSLSDSLLSIDIHQLVGNLCTYPENLYSIPIQFEIILEVPEVISVENITISNEQSECYNATNTITVAGSGTTVNIYPEGEAIFIAGEKILFEPGFTAHPGSYVQAYITTTGNYCSNQQSMMANNVTMPDLDTKALSIEALDNTNDGQDVVIYPNPTTGDFTVDFMGIKTTAEIQVLNFQGNMVYQTKCDNQIKAKIDISYLSGGMYIAVIKSSKKVITKKVVKVY